MKRIDVPRSAMQLACAFALLASAAGHAQTQRSIGSAAPVAGPSMAARTATPAGGLPSPLPNPAGLPDPTRPGISNPGVAPGSPVVDPGVQQTVMGAGGGSRPVYMIPGSYTAVQIAGSFIAADANRDGDLTRAEALRLPIAPFSFEEMDANHDGVLSRSEYENALR